MFLLRKIKNDFLHETSLSLVLLLVFFFLMMCFELDIVNREISDILFKRMGINIVLYGDINSEDGHCDSIDVYNKINQKYSEISDGLESLGGNKLMLEKYFQSNRVYSAEDIYNEMNYLLVYSETSSDSMLKTENQNLLNISSDFENNRHYYSALEMSHFNPNQTELALLSTYRQLSPLFVGVNNLPFSDLYLNDIQIIDGRTFTEQELRDGENVVIVNQNTYIFERGGIRSAAVGDIIPITIEVEGNTEIFYFKIIGINNGTDSGGIAVPSAEAAEQTDEIWLHNNNYHNMFFMPEKSLNVLINAYYQMCTDRGIEITKDSFTNNDPNFIYYSLYGGYRPAVINIYDVDKMEMVIDFLSDKIVELNQISDFNTPFTYYSNADRYISIIGSVRSNEKLFHYLCFISAIVAIVALLAMFVNDLDSSKQEMGIMIALGMSKSEAVLSKIAEYALLSIIPVFLAFGLSDIVCKKYVELINRSIIDIDISNIFMDSGITKIVVKSDHRSLITIVGLYIAVMLFSCVLTFIHIQKMSVSRILLEGDK